MRSRDKHCLGSQDELSCEIKRWNSWFISRMDLNEGKVNGLYRDIGSGTLAYFLYGTRERV